MEISKNKNAKGKHWHKQPPGLNVSKTKRQAMKDISEYCKEENSFFDRVYIPYEFEILKMTKR